MKAYRHLCSMLIASALFGGSVCSPQQNSPRFWNIESPFFGGRVEASVLAIEQSGGRLSLTTARGTTEQPEHMLIAPWRPIMALENCQQCQNYSLLAERFLDPGGLQQRITLLKNGQEILRIGQGETGGGYVLGDWRLEARNAVGGELKNSAHYTASEAALQNGKESIHLPIGNATKVIHEDKDYSFTLLGAKLRVDAGQHDGTQEVSSEYGTSVIVIESPDFVADWWWVRTPL